MKRTKAGLSVVLSAVILSSVLLVVTMIAFNFSISIMSAQAQNSEFEEMKNDLLLLADVVEDISLKPLAAGYVTFSSQSGSMSFLTNQSAISVDARATGYPTRNLLSGSASSLKYRGGSQVGGILNDYLKGSTSYLISVHSTPLTRVYLQYNRAPYIIMDSRVVRIANLGTYYYYNRGDNQSGYLNMIEVTLLNITYGKLVYSNPMNVRALNKDMRITQFSFLNNQVNVMFDVRVDDKVTNYLVSGPSTTPDGTPISGTTVRVVYLEVSISTVGS